MNHLIIPNELISTYVMSMEVSIFIGKSEGQVCTIRSLSTRYTKIRGPKMVKKGQCEYGKGG